MSSKNAIRGKNTTVSGGQLVLLFEKKTVKRFAQCHVFTQPPPGRRPSDKYPVNTSHRS